MPLLEEIDSIWTPDHARLADGWAADLQSNLSRFESASKRFRAAAPLDVYLTVSRAKKATAIFSLRYLGQAIAELAVDKKEVHLKINKRLAASNAKFFKIAEEGNFRWQEARARAFRNHFKCLDPEAVRVGIPEHRIEAEFLKQMGRADRRKFGGTLASIQPVSLAGCRFQFPLPLSASSGKPRNSRGNIDILARRGIGRGTRLSVWELKAPGAKIFPIEQAYIYAVTLLKILRSDSGQFWYQNIFGFKGGLPKALTVESVVAVGSSGGTMKKSIGETLAAFSRRETLQIGNDTIKLCIAYYDHLRQPLTIEFEEVLPTLPTP